MTDNTGFFTSVINRTQIKGNRRVRALLAGTAIFSGLMVVKNEFGKQDSKKRIQLKKERLSMVRALFAPPSAFLNI